MNQKPCKNDRGGTLLKLAIEARKYAYAPYSGFRVGAALLGKSGTVYKGCNVENAAFSPTNCAERTAFFKAISEGEKEFEAIAIVGGKTHGEALENPCLPCGVCRQVMAEFCDEDFLILVAENQDEFLEYTLEELLPLGFAGKAARAKGIKVF